MKSTILVFGLLVAVNILSSCDSKRESKNVDSFYTTRSFGDIPTRPLLKPLSLSFDDIHKKWYLEIPHFFKQRMNIDSIKKIGVEKTYVFGNVLEEKRICDSYNNGDFVVANKFGKVYYDSKKFKTEADEIQLQPIDIKNNIFLIPERWYVINVADSTIKAFFSKSKYQNYLKKKDISGTLYNIDSIDNEFIKTGILPWFPDGVKVKLRK